MPVPSESDWVLHSWGAPAHARGKWHGPCVTCHELFILNFASALPTCGDSACGKAPGFHSGNSCLKIICTLMCFLFTLLQQQPFPVPDSSYNNNLGFSQNGVFNTFPSKGHWSEYVKLLILLALHRLAQISAVFIVCLVDKVIFIL